jgi:hypothetical protein
MRRVRALTPTKVLKPSAEIDSRDFARLNYSTYKRNERKT